MPRALPDPQNYRVRPLSSRLCVDLKGLPAAVPCASEHIYGTPRPSRYCTSISGARTLLQDRRKNRRNSPPLRTQPARYVRYRTACDMGSRYRGPVDESL